MLSRNNDRPQTWELRRALQAAEGYCTLGMLDEALEALDEGQDHCELDDPSVLQARIRILLNQKRWSQAERLSRIAVRAYVEEEEFKVQRAFALHQLDQGDEAVRVLLSLPGWMIQTGVVHYNLACYEARMGDPSVARRCIKAAIEINAAFRKTAKDDPDLANLWS